MKKILSVLFSQIFMFSAVSIASDKSADADKRVEKIHKKIISIDSHTDTPLRLQTVGFDISQRHDPVQDHSKVDFPRMREGRLDAAFFAVFVSQGKRDFAGNQGARQKADLLFDTIYSMLARNTEIAGLALTPEDAWKLKKKGKSAVFIGIENGYPIGNDIDMVKSYYDRGARYITLCHTKNNDICDSSTDTTEFNGLSDFGKNVVLMMNKVGMMVDVSHISDKSFYDVLSLSKAPVIASHSCARALCKNPRNLSDSMLVALAKNGGVIQMCILSDYVKTPPPNPARDSAKASVRKKWRDFNDLSEDEMKDARKDWYAIDEKYPQTLATVSDVVDHIDHIVKIAGIDHVGIGTDFDGGGGVTGCFDVSGMKNITKELVLRGYSDGDIGKIWGGEPFTRDETGDQALEIAQQTLSLRQIKTANIKVTQMSPKSKTQPWSSVFIDSLEKNSLDKMRTVPKSDLHNHGMMGGRLKMMEKLCGVSIEKFKAGDEGIPGINKWIVNAYRPLMKQAGIFENAMNAAFLQAKHDGVTVLEMSIDLFMGKLLNISPSEIAETLDRIHKSTAPEIDFRPELGFNRSFSVRSLLAAFEPYLGLDYFRAIDLYDDESAQPVRNFHELFRFAKARGYRCKAHAGEFSDAESVREAVEILELDAVQHGIGAAGNPEVMKWLADLKIPLHTSPISNISLKRIRSFKTHPIRILYDHGVKVTVNTDDVMLFDKGNSEQFLRLSNCGLFSAGELDEIRMNGLD